MQKLPETPDMRKEKELFWQKKETHSLSTVTVGLKTTKSSLLLVEDHMSCFMWHAGLSIY